MRLFLKRVFCQNAVFWKASFCCEITPGATTKTPWVALAGSHAGCNNWDCYRVTTHQHFWKSRCSFSVVVLTSFVAAGAVVVSSSGAVVAEAVVVGSSRTVVDKSRCCYVFMIYCCWAVVLANSRSCCCCWSHCWCCVFTSCFVYICCWQAACDLGATLVLVVPPCTTTD